MKHGRNGRYKYWWRPSVVDALHAYKRLKEERESLKSTSMTANYNSMPKGSDPSRTTENIAMRQLPEDEERWVDAIDGAVEEVRTWKDGEEVIKIVELLDFKRSHSIDGVAYALHMHRNTVIQKRTRFIDVVARRKGLL